MANQSSDADEMMEISDLLQQLRDKLKLWNKKHGHPFQGISDGLPTTIRKDLMPACQAFADRSDLIAALPKGKRFAEIGTFFGKFAVQILELNQPKELHTFDWNLHLIIPEYREILDRSKKMVYYEGDPSVSVNNIPPGSYDIVYLNKSKNYAGVRRELNSWLPCVAPEGYLVVNDYTSWDPVQGFAYGTLSAVSQFINEQSLQVAFISLQSRGFLNIALRRS